MDIDEIKKILDELEIINYSIRPDGIVDVDGNVDICNRNLKTIPVQFGIVKGSFSCNDNQLISLEGCPKKIKKDFWCSHNQLTSLKGCPEEVGGDFWCDSNQLISLEGCPKKVGRVFSCDNNQLISLKGYPKKVGGDFWCTYNPITSLGDFDPESVSGEIFGINFKNLDTSKLTLKQKKWIISKL